MLTSLCGLHRNGKQSGQISAKASQTHDQIYHPAVYQEWSLSVVEAALIRKGRSVWDMACGTGMLARTVMAPMGGEGAVVGVGINKGMLTVSHIHFLIKEARHEMARYTEKNGAVAFPTRAHVITVGKPVG